MKTIFKNWKTTLAGVIVAGTAVAVSLGYINQETATAIGVIAGAFGLVLAKDGNVTGLAK